MTLEDPWARYGRTLTQAMAEVLDEIPEELRSHVLETADYWISVGLTIGLERPLQARRLGADRSQRVRAGHPRGGRGGLRRGGPHMRRRGLVSQLYRTARLANDVSAIRSGNPHRIARRAKNKIVGRAIARAGIWRLLWGR